jgi:hypothetical protein
MNNGTILINKEKEKQAKGGVHACNPNSLGTEEGRLNAQGQPEIHSKTVSRKKENKIIMYCFSGEIFRHRHLCIYIFIICYNKDRKQVDNISRE